MVDSPLRPAVEDERLPLLGVLCNPRETADFLSRHAGTLVGGRPIASLTMQHMTYRPGRQCVASYDIEFAEKGDEGTRTLTVTLAKDERLATAYRGTAAAAGAVYLATERCLIEAFPYDYEVPSLATAWDAASAATLMREAGIDVAVNAPLAVETLSYRPHEACVLAYEGQRGAGAPLRLIGKAMREPYKVEHVHLVAQAVASQLPDGDVRIARTYRPETERRLVFMERAAGTSLHEALASAADDAARRRLIGQTVDVLLALHRVEYGGMGRPARGLRQALAHARERTARLQFATTGIGALAEALLDRVEPLIRDEDVPSVLLHADFKGTQLLFDGSAVTVIDFDGAGPGDAAIDVGNMMADLHREAALAGAEGSRALAGHLLEAYVAASPDAGLRGRARALQVIALVRMAVHAFRQQPFGGDEDEFAPRLLLAEAEACLQAL